MTCDLRTVVAVASSVSSVRTMCARLRPSIGRRLVWANPGVGLTFASQTCAESVDTLLALASGFTAGEIIPGFALTEGGERFAVKFAAEGKGGAGETEEGGEG